MKRLSSIILALLLLLGTIPAYAATSWDVFNVPDMRLKVRITSVQTTGIKIAPPTRNGVTVSYPALSGGILQILQGTKVEHIYYSRATVNATTKVITLTGSVVRDIPWNSATSFTGAGGGQVFTPGAVVRLVNDARLYNLAMKKDRANVCTASGCTQYSGSGTFLPPVYATAAQRNAQNPQPRNGMIAYQTDTGALIAYVGGVWGVVAAGGTVNASETVAGKIELGTIAEQISKADVGTTGAPLVPQTKNLTSSGSRAWTGNNSYQAGRIPILNSSGALPATLGGLGRTNVQSGSLVVGQGSGAVKTVAPGTTNNVLTSNGVSWVSAAPLAYEKPVFISTGSSTATGASSTVKHYLDTNFYEIPANDLINGVCYEFETAGTHGWGAGTMTLRIELGTTVIFGSTLTPSTTGQPWVFNGSICGTAAAGASVAVRAQGILGLSVATDAKTSYEYAEVNVATNAAKVFHVSQQFGTSNATNSVTNTFMKVKKVSTTPF